MTEQDATTYKTTFAVPKMDCSSEERMVRMALEGVSGLRSLSFDLPNRKFTAVHQVPAEQLLSKLQPLGLGAKLVESSTAEQQPIYETTFAIPKMDCTSEEGMVRMALDGVGGVRSLTFNLQERTMQAVHTAPAEELLRKLQPLGFGATITGTRAAEAADDDEIDPPDNAGEARLLWVLLTINAAMFFIEFGVGLFAQSTGLIADSLDMFADAAVYGLSLFAVGRAAAAKTRAAHAAGWLQLVLALGALAEVIRRFIGGSEPVSALMMGMGLVALVANVTCLVLVSKKRDAGAHMKASYIFSANDVIANAGVIAAGALVWATGSPYPDLVIGTIVGLVVLNGARRILRLK